MTDTLDTVPISAALVRGALELEPTPRGTAIHRLPAWARAQCPDPQLAMAEAQPAGVRLAARTRATAVEIDVLPTKRAFTGLPARPDGLYVLHVDGERAAEATARGGDTISVDLRTGSAETATGQPVTLRFDGLPDRGKDIEIWLPHNESVLLAAVRSDAPLEPLPDRRPVWLHHGSSISHGSNATDPTATWPVLAAAAGGAELVNLGIGGSALLDPFTARTMRGLPADLVSVKIGINIANSDLMRMRAFGPAVHGFLDTLREGHPDAPLLLIGPLYCPIHEDTPGPGAFDPAALAEGRVGFRATGDPADAAAGRLTLTAIRAELERIAAERAATDPHLSYLDGKVLYGPADHAELPLPDGLHPGAAAHRRIGARFADHAFAPGGPFAASDS